MPKQRRHISLPPELWPRLEAEATNQHRSLNNLIELALSEWLQQKGQAK